MEPIVSPRLVWLVAIADSVRALTQGIAIFSAAVAAGSMLFVPIMIDNSPTGKAPKVLKRAVVMLVSLSLLCGAIYALTPTTKQATMIVAATMVTKNAVTKADSTIKTVYDDMLSLIREQLSDKEDEK